MSVAPDPVQDEELTIPRASMNKMIKELLPNVRVANEARELILNCCTEFIHLVSSEANEICNQQQKKTINAEHILACVYLCVYIYLVVCYRVRAGLIVTCLHIYFYPTFP
ncbi:Protein Dr1 [Portunus trituberculatus]|uniref:Protein Dr1 n=1 Tax=Portunus trituberculatus TaxID=210409 RepID=A0A5B7J9P7_PORTR|nr:Protein Dr1 [Portunus trituberculatus]